METKYKTDEFIVKTHYYLGKALTNYCKEHNLEVVSMLSRDDNGEEFRFVFLFREVSIIHNEYFKDLNEWENSFSCSECGELNHKKFIYNRTVANGEVWICKNCKTEVVVNEEPKEDNY